MTAWIRFINKTSFNVIYIMIDGRFVPIPLPKDCISHYILTSAGSVSVDIFDAQLRCVKSIYASVIPQKKQIILLY